MEVTVPVRYYPFARCSYQYVPLYVVESDPQAVEIPDVWSEARVHRRYSAIHHIKLPPTFVWPIGGDDVRLAPFMTHGGSGAIHEAMDLDWSRRQTDVNVVIPLGGRGVIRTRLLIDPVPGGHRIYISGGYNLSVFRGIYHDEDQAGKYYYLQDVKVISGGSLRTSDLSFSTLRAMFESLPTGHTWKTFVSPSSFRTTEHRPSAAQVTNWVEGILKSHEDFEESKLVEAQSKLVKERTLGGVTTTRIREQPGPLWTKSNSKFLGGKGQAYVEALHDCRKVGTNNLKNLINAYNACWHFVCNRKNMDAFFNALATGMSSKKHSFGGIKLLERKHGQVRIELPALPEAYSSGWFGGRYVLNCAVMDANQAWQYFYHQTQVWMGKESRWQKCHGSYTDNDGRLWQCTFSMVEKAHAGIQKMFSTLYNLGLEPNAYVLWDMIPYSFVVDWFIPVGSALENISQVTQHLPTAWSYIHQFGPYAFCYSVQYTYDTPFGRCDSYTRWYEEGPPNVDSWDFIFHDTHSPSHNVECMRYVDALCLIFR